MKTKPMRKSGRNLAAGGLTYQKESVHNSIKGGRDRVWTYFEGMLRVRRSKESKQGGGARFCGSNGAKGEKTASGGEKEKSNRLGAKGSDSFVE